jgi:hypothetical protein
MLIDEIISAVPAAYEIVHLSIFGGHFGSKQSEATNPLKESSYRPRYRDHNIHWSLNLSVSTKCA